MNFFMSAEVDAAVGDAEHVTRNTIDPMLVEALQHVHLEFDVQRWSFISVIFPETAISRYPEVIKHHKKKKVLEFRLHLSHEAFNHADEAKRIAMVLESIGRSIDLMSGFNVGDGDRTILRAALETVRTALLDTP